MMGDDTYIHVVSDGEYSDYRVLCACDTKAAADRVAALINAPDEDGYAQGRARVEKLLVVGDDIERQSVLRLTVNVWDDGTTSETSEWKTDEWPWDYMGTPRLQWRWVRAPVHRNKGGRLEVHGTDHEAVRKTFSDKRAQLLAEDTFRNRREVNS